jgi:hypothetical protein
LNSSLFGAAIWGCLVALFQAKKKKQAQSAVYSHMVCSLCGKCVGLRILLEKRRKRDCGGGGGGVVLLVKCHSAWQSASNCTAQS